MSKLIYKILGFGLVGLWLAVTLNFFGDTSLVGDLAKLAKNNLLAQALPTTPLLPQSFLVTVYKPGTGGGVVTSSDNQINCGPTCSAEYLQARDFTLTAVPDSNSTFVEWQGGQCNGIRDTTCYLFLSHMAYSVITEVEIKAIFASTLPEPTYPQPEYQIEFGRSFNFGRGILRVKSTWADGSTYDFSCGYPNYRSWLGIISEMDEYNDDCYAPLFFDSGTQFRVYAEPDPFNSVFGGWDGCTPDPADPFTCTLTPTSDTLIRAKFVSANDVTVVKKGTGNGVVTTLGTYTQFINCGNKCYQELNIPDPSTWDHPFWLSATADSNSVFVGWEGCAEVISGNCELFQGGQKKIIAIFDLKLLTLTVTKSGTGTGVVASVQPGIYCGSGQDCSAKFGQSSQVTLRAYKDAGSVFAGWTGCDSVSNDTCTATMGSGRTINAQFDLLP